MVKGIHSELFVKARQRLVAVQEEMEEANIKLNEAIKLGDLSENSEYDAAKERVKKLQKLAEELKPVLDLNIIKSNDNVNIIEPGSIIRLTIYNTTKRPVNNRSEEVKTITSLVPEFDGLLAFGCGLRVNSLLDDKVLFEDSPIGQKINGRQPGFYSVKVPAGYANLTVEKIPYGDNDNIELWIKYGDQEV